ncbi:MAG: hypothetical protein JO101_06055 [Candidatus Eremiobacteraeota bacterium]|nr:hypothetical protein [Candidatus Eremiobacteraeota bacterium]MBV8354862.1 hypothetical protein [Candidatus Eremiobacteraeota bacterium]
MMAAMILVTASLLIVGVGLLTLAIVAPIKPDVARAPTPVDRIRALEALRPDAIDELAHALDDPEPTVATIAAIRLLEAGRADLVHASGRTPEVSLLLAP